MNCYESKIKDIKYIIVFALMTCIFYSLAILLSSDSYIRVNAFKFLGWIGVLYCGCMTIFYIFKIFKNIPSVVIDKKGITDYRWRKALIPWTDIISVGLIEIEERKALEVWGRYTNTTILFDDLNPSLDKVWEYIQTNHPTKIEN